VGSVYLVLLVAGAGMLLAANRMGWQQKHFNYRALAESLRVQFFWRLARLEASVADGYLRAQREDLHGIRLAIRFFELSFDDEGESGDGAADRERIRTVFRDWVVAQRRYFLGEPGTGRAGVAGRDSRRQRRILLLSKLCLAAAIILVLLLVLLHGTLDLSRGVITTLSGSLLGIAAAALGYNKVMGFGEHVRSAAKMGELFARAERELGTLTLASPAGAPEREAGELAHAREVLLDLGREALAENADWVILHRARPWEFSLT